MTRGKAATRSKAVLICAGLALLAGVLLSPWLVAPARGQRGIQSGPARHLIRYTAWDGHLRSAVLLLPAWYKRGSTANLPLVITPHGRGESPVFMADRWGRLPNREGFAVICPAGEGERLPGYSCAAPGQISDLARMPAVIESALPWVHIDRRRVYVVGCSMGGQEALVLAARYPDRIAAAVSVDGLADLASHYYDMPCPRRSGRVVLHDMVVECGGTPAQKPLSYALRSPLTYAEDLAFDDVPVELWWSRSDQVVVDQARAQSGLLYRRIRSLNPGAPVREIVTNYPHCAAFCAAIALPRVVAFLRPDGRWRCARTAPPLR